jgi:hypothetical protein
MARRLIREHLFAPAASAIIDDWNKNISYMFRASEQEDFAWQSQSVRQLRISR